MAAATYLTRTLTPVLQQAARHFPNVVLTGPRQSGRTTLIRLLPGGYYPIFVYEGGVSFPVAASVRYWFVAQAGDHTYPPQLGRLAAGAIPDCLSMFRSICSSYPDWIFDGFVEFDASQEFECGVVPTRSTSRVAVKGIYR